jgi:bifunctional UDP-N-acetylglucosamine pyrophosphorylase/glucosamine-1-phosphate N-acetyltransferase
MILHVLDALSELPLDKVVVVVGHGSEQVTKVVTAEAPADLHIEFVEQATQRGTGDAVAVGLTALPENLDTDTDGDVIVLPGDTPLIGSETIEKLVKVHLEGDQVATLLTAKVPDPFGYGRILRDKHGDVLRIVEHADADGDTQEIDEICTSVYIFKYSVLGPGLRRLVPQNQQKEYYLTDIVGVLADAGYRLDTIVLEDFTEAMGVNDKSQLAAASAVLRDRINASWMKAGVAMEDPKKCYIDASVVLGKEVTLYPNTILRGTTHIGDFAKIGPNCDITDCVIGIGAEITNTVAESSEIADFAKVGPFAYLSSGTIIDTKVATGPFYFGSDQ